MRPLLLLCVIAALSALSISPVCARENEGVKPSAAEPDPSPRVLLIGNEMLRSSNITFLLHALMQSAGWEEEGEADAEHPDPAHPSIVYEHYHDGYTLGPNPWTEQFDPTAYEAFDASQTDLAAATAAGLNDTESRADMPERSRIPLANLLRPSLQRLRINAAWKAQSDFDLGNHDLLPWKSNALPFPVAPAFYRQRFNINSPIATSEQPKGSEPPRKQIKWAPYDTEKVDPQALGFHGAPVADAGVAIFSGEAEMGSLLLTPANASSNSPAPNSKLVWPALFPEVFALNVWLKIEQLPPSPTKVGAFAGAILDCRPPPPAAGVTPPPPEDGSVIQLRIVVTEAGGAPRMRFRYTNAEGTAEQTALSPALIDPSDPADPHALLTNKWEMWSVNFQELNGPASMQLYRNGLAVGDNNATHSLEPKFSPWFSERLFTVPQVPRICKLGHNASPDATKGGGTFFKGLMADLTLWKDSGVINDSVKKMYLELRPAHIKLAWAPKVKPVVMGGETPPEEGSAEARSFRSPVQRTALSHAFCAGTLRLFNRTATPLEWGTVVLSDHVLAPFIPWWFRHSLLPGLEILTSAILAHSPRAKILLLEGWAPGADALSKDLVIASIKAYGETKVAAAAAGAAKDAAQLAANREIFAPFTDAWTAADVRARIQGHYRRAQQFLLADAANYAYDYGVQRVTPVDASSVSTSDLPYAGLTLLNERNFEVLPVLGAWDKLAAKATEAVPDPTGETPTPAAADLGWGKRPEEFFLVPPEDAAPVAPTEPVEASNADLCRVATPSGLGAFVIATQLFTAITLHDASASCNLATGTDDEEPPAACVKGFCPCTLAPLPMVGPTAPTFAAQLAEQRELAQTRCALVRISSAEAFAESFPPASSSDKTHDFSAPFEWKAGPADADHALCNLPLPSSDSAAASSTGGDDDEMGTPPNVNPGPNDDDYNNGHVSGEEAGVGEEPSLVPVWIAVVILFLVALGAVAWFFLRRNRLRWQLVDSRGYDDSDKAQFDMESNSAPAAVASPSRGGPQADVADEDGL